MNQPKGAVLLLILGLSMVASGQAEARNGDDDHSKALSQRPATAMKPLLSVSFSLAGNLPIISLEINGHKNENFIIDSGAAPTILNSKELPKLRIQSTQSNVPFLPGSGDSVGQATLIAKSVRIGAGKIWILKGETPAIDLSRMSSELGIDIAGIIGYDVLRAHVSAIDYISHRFLIYRERQWTLPLGPHSLSLSVQQNGTLPITQIRVGFAGRELGPSRVLIDTGFQRSMMITARLGQKEDLQPSSDWKYSHGFGIGGEFSYYYGVAGWLILGTDRVEIPNASMSQALRGTTANNMFDAALGGAILDKYEVIFDVSNGRVVLVGEQDQNPI